MRAQDNAIDDWILSVKKCCTRLTYDLQLDFIFVRETWFILVGRSTNYLTIKTFKFSKVFEGKKSYL